MTNYKLHTLFWISTFAILLTGNTPTYGVCSQNISVIAHRGNSSENPENTQASFQSAIDMHVDFIELDIHLCKDNVPCVFHDRSTSRTTNSEGQLYIEELTVNDLKELDAGGWFSESFSGQQIPTLEEVLQMPLRNTGVMIEIKEGSASNEALASAVSAVVRKYSRIKSGNPIIVGSLSPEITLELRTFLPELPIIAIVEDLEDIPRFKAARAQIYAVKYDLLTQDVYNELSNNDKVVWTFTVDDSAAMHKMADIGVSGIITNRPKELINVREELAEKCYNVINVSRVIPIMFQKSVFGFEKAPAIERS
jgi:glycerophosphoryl diester phosphodiesterase